ncbi:MAG: MarR family winged helix-turn-helix transcriptional regulator [Archangium sp.]|nr:MarR family winged helix-turn-helix transcriptional regulator [Archangium sp.]
MKRPKPDTTAVLDGLRRVVKALRENSRAAEQTLGISGAQLFVLDALSGEQGLSLSEVAARTRTHQSSVSVVVSRLVSAGLVRRVRAGDDARRLELRLTARGRALRSKAPQAAQHGLIDAVERLPAPQRRALAEALGRVCALMDLPRTAPAMFFEEARRHE